MGRPGGFFKRLKAKQKRQSSRRRRGTKGASKEERRVKHNERVDYYAAKREAEELAAISSSSDSDVGAASTDSEAELRREEQALMRLRQLIGAAGGGEKKNGRRNNNNNNDNNNNNNNNNNINSDNENERKGEDASKKMDNGNTNKNEKKKKGNMGAVDEMSEDSEDWRAYLSSGEEEEEEIEEMEDQEMDDDDDDEQHEDEDYDEDEEESEELDMAKEDAYKDEDENDGDYDKDEEEAKETAQLLPQFHHGTTSLTALQDVVSATDPWFVKYHQDRHGDIDTTAMEQQPCGDPNISVSASAHAVQYLLHKPFAVDKTSHLTNTSVSGVGKRQQKQEKTEERPPYMHETLWKKWLEYCTAESRGPMTEEERGLLDLLQGYPDVIDCCRSWDNANSRREIFLLHVLNHWFKARSVVLAHDALLRERRAKKKKKEKKNKKKNKSGSDSSKKKAKDESDNDNEDDEEYELRDRGFGKTRLLIMLPMRNIAHRYMMTLVKLLRAAPDDCPKLSTFNEDFSELEEAMDPTFKRRPREYQMQFAGNVDDAFCVGVRLAPSRVGVYAHPLNSDLIICSPLGLRRRLERSGDATVSLASVEVCIVDEAHVLLMQNWQHAAHVLRRLLNKRPTDTTHGLADLRRVYGWALAGHSGRHRQTIMSTNVSHATLLATVRAACLNNSGRVLLQRREENGVLSQVMVPVRQHFIRFEPSQPQNVEGCDETRFDFFTHEVFATKISPLAQRDVRTIIFVPSYFDFVRLRNYMIREYRDTFAAISEYTSLQQQRKALGQFTDLERPLLLVTERFYFFKRYFVKLAEVMVFYSPPVFPAFYVSLVNRLVATSPNAFALTVFCRFDTHELNRIVGTRRTRQLLEREADAFSFVTN
ncbi:Digestive organ expansion factor [Trypanosoma melophagium]|uniref:Digestive organ expansion factor n=1 Tax=Trypanosoma melophagium TaxID=715481 RepID=UPI00351A1218|nr:Digestive organ expansion factor [Trypanosoma melophagium]